MDIKTQAPTLSADDKPDFKTDLTRAKSCLQKGQFNQAIEILNAILAQAPNHIDGLYMLAVSQRYIQNYDAALSTLEKLKSVTPDYGRAYQEEGHIFIAQNQPQKALKAYQIACQFNPGLEASFLGLAKIFNQLGSAADAEIAQQQYERLKKLPRALHSSMNLLHEGKLLKAEKLCKQYMRTDKTNIEGMRLLADIANRLGARDEAQFLYETALEIEPKNHAVLMDFVNFLKAVQQPKKALKYAKLLDDTYPNNPMLQSILAIQNLQVGDHDTALELFDKVLERLPNDPITLTSRGHALKTIGDQDAAIESYRNAVKAQPEHGEAFFSLANLKTYKFLDSEIKTMETVLNVANLTLQNKANLTFSLGKAYEDRKDFKTAFKYYDQGNEYKRTQSRYSADKMEQELTDQIEQCTSDVFKVKAGMGCMAPDPIFILGLPRAGSTLLEQIVASHSQVDGTLELPNILTLTNHLRGQHRRRGATDYPAVLQELEGESLLKFGQAFIEDTRIHRQDAPFFIDKMPNNFRHIGLIHLILPNAKIIDARRHPMACCFSGFKQLFAEGQEFTYGLEQIGRYYKDYVRLMDHWDEVLPGKILRVQYEDVVADTETQVRRILDYLGLPFEQACVDFHKTERSVRTASSEQVRQPIFKSGLEQWRNFEPWLDPLKEALGPVLERYPIDKI